MVILRRRRPRIAPWNAADLVEDMNRGNRDAEVFTLTCGFCLAQLWRGEPHTGACNEANGERS